MTAMRVTLITLAVLLGVMAAADASAHGRRHHGGVRFGVFVGAPAFWYYPPPYYHYPPYYYPRTVVVPASPPVYIEQGHPAPAPPPSDWYYCREADAYYPYVDRCAGPWERVAPHPPS